MADNPTTSGQSFGAWALRRGAVLETLDTNLDGLTSQDAEKRLAKYGRNELPAPKPKSWVSRFLDLETGEAEHTADISRRHAITESKEQVISVVGGKFTEYRLMAEQTVDFAVKARRLAAGACRTKNFPLLGAPGHMDYMMVSAKDLYGLPQGLVDRHGYAALEVMEAAADHGMKRPLETVAGTDITRAEVAFAVTHEAATCVADILERRTRLAMVPVAPEIQTEVANIIQELI